MEWLSEHPKEAEFWVGAALVVFTGLMIWLKVPGMAGKALRVSGGWTTTPEDWTRFYDVWSKGYEAYLKRHVKAPEKELN